MIPRILGPAPSSGLRFRLRFAVAASLCLVAIPAVALTMDGAARNRALPAVVPDAVVTGAETVVAGAETVVAGAETVVAGADAVVADAVVADTDLPNAPGWRGIAGQAGQAAQASQSTGSVAGVVLDISEAGVPGATVTLTQEGAVERVLRSEAHGEFLFTGLPAGTFHITISARGLETFISAEIVLKAGQHHILPQIALPVEPENSTVTVTVTQDELAQAQLKSEMQQRVFGVLPNFYSSYIWNAAPLRPRHKFELAFRSVSDPAVFLVTGITAGIEQAHNTYKDYGQGAAGYGRRYGAAYGDVVVGRIIGSALLPTIFHQDPRYFYLGIGSIKSRAWYAMSRSVITRQDNRRAQLNYSHLLGSMAAGAVSKLYHPGGENGITLVERNLLIGTAANATVNLIREFLLRKVVTKIPVYEQGKAVAMKESAAH